jgi:biotin synthase
MTQKKWTLKQAKDLFFLPFMELAYRAQKAHRRFFPANRIQVSTLLSIKTGRCSENCGYCSQSNHHKTNLQPASMLSLKEVLAAAQQAKAQGCTRFCMGASGRGPSSEDLKCVCEMITEVKSLGLETCVTLGLLTYPQACTLKETGLDYYNHNIDTSAEYYQQIVTTRTFQDRITTLEHVRKAGIRLCCGGILGMGETNEDRLKMLLVLANFNPHPESVPINKLIKIPGTRFENELDVDPFDFVRTIAVARLLLPHSYIRLSAGREQVSDELQAWSFFCGANSIFFGEQLLTVKNSACEKDEELFTRLGLEKEVL